MTKSEINTLCTNVADVELPGSGAASDSQLAAFIKGVISGIATADSVDIAFTVDPSKPPTIKH